MSNIKFIFNKILIPFFMVLFTTALTINAINYMTHTAYTDPDNQLLLTQLTASSLAYKNNISTHKFSQSVKKSPGNIFPNNKIKENLIIAEYIESRSDIVKQLTYDELESVEITKNDFAIEEINPVIIDDDNLFYEQLETMLIDENIGKDKEEMLSKTGFTSNPCNTAAARYIARCLKRNRKR